MVTPHQARTFVDFRLTEPWPHIISSTQARPNTVRPIFDTNLFGP